MNGQGVTRQTLERLPMYLNYLNGLPGEPVRFISSAAIAQALSLNDVVVRKDLAAVCSAGKPRVGYPMNELKEALSVFLGYRDVTDAVLVGAGRLGRALMGYEGFKAYGLNIVAAFDVEGSLQSTTDAGIPVFPVSRIAELCARLKVRIGIITTPACASQDAANALVEGGVLAIWNFAPAHLSVPPQILVQNENMAASLAILSKHLTKALYEESEKKVEGTENERI